MTCLKKNSSWKENWRRWGKQVTPGIDIGRVQESSAEGPAEHPGALYRSSKRSMKEEADQPGYPKSVLAG